MILQQYYWILCKFSTFGKTNTSEEFELFYFYPFRLGIYEKVVG